MFLTDVYAHQGYIYVSMHMYTIYLCVMYSIPVLIIVLSKYNFFYKIIVNVNELSNYLVFFFFIMVSGQKLVFCIDLCCVLCCIMLFCVVLY